MSPDLLLANFGRIADTPDAIPRLRRFILDLAVRGKLVEQDPKDEPASELLKQIRAQRMQSSKGRLKGEPALYEIDDAEQLFPVPTGWIWLRFGELHALYRGVTYTKADVSETSAPGYLPILRANNIGATLNFEDPVFVRKERVGAEQILRRGDYLIALSSGSKNLVGKAAFVAADYEGGFGGFCGAIRLFTPTVEPFVGLFLSSRLYRDALAQGSRGIGINNLKKETITNVLFPLPPLSEQQRIVAKVDELMAQCDRLEAAQVDRESRRDRLVVASLYCLNNSADAESFRAHARFHFHHLPRLTTRPEHIHQLRQTILKLAIRGKLLSQDPNDEPVATQLALSDRARQATAKEDRRADDDLQTLLAAEDRWDVPSSWKWRGLADVVLFIDYRGQTPSKVEQGVRLITAKNVKKGFINPLPEEFLSEPNYQTWMTRGFPKEGDVLFTTEAPMGNAAVVRVQERFALAQRVICFRPYGAVNPDFLVLQLLAEPFQSILGKTATGLTAKGIKAAKLKRLPVVVPPLAEQHRIVAKVEELMALCSQLTAQLTTTQNESCRLLEAVLHKTLDSSSIRNGSARLESAQMHCSIVDDILAHQSRSPT